MATDFREFSRFCKDHILDLNGIVYILRGDCVAIHPGFIGYPMRRHSREHGWEIQNNVGSLSKLGVKMRRPTKQKKKKNNDTRLPT